MAVYGFKGLGWFATSLTVALGGYMIMSQGAAERAKLHTIENRIADAKRDIRNLETEFSTRANLAQLERWNVESAGMGMAAPATQQFVEGEMALSDLDKPTEAVEKVALVVPAVAPRAAPAIAVASRDPAATASARPTGSANATNRTVAMVDKRQLLSPSTLGDLDRSAATERSERQDLR